MHLIFNELSCYPTAINSQIAEKRFTKLLQTYKAAIEKYDFNHIRFPQNYSDLQITSSETFIEWINAISNSVFKNLILGIFKKPYMDDLRQRELSAFFESNYVIDDNMTPTSEPPIGLPIAFIKSIPAISIDSHSFWNNRKIYIQKTNGSNIEYIKFFSYNICQKNDINSIELNEWANNCMSKFIDSQDMLTNFLSFGKYTPFFTDKFMEQFYELKANHTKQYKYLLLLMKDVELHPFTGGMGKTENLQQRGKEASKQITQLDRLSYTLNNNIINFIACKGHYDFH
ncbi:MAG: type II toxin-antitoxin system YoeB family toxin [Chlorobi bacterium]|nr:type II toxin-antitoxin system YoeB family toxin [Chlorobiota bacterium]